MKKLFCTVLFTIQLLAALPNMLSLKGLVVDMKNGNPVPFVNIAVLGTYHGTVSNNAGGFVLHLPNSLKNETITFSCIGYETYELNAPHNSNALTIKLMPLTYEVGEITVMPDSTLRTLIRMAYRKIPDNYPDFRTRSKGFYREAMQTKNSEFLVLTEAMLEVFKTSYKFSGSGQIKIDKSRTYVAPGIDSVNDVGFYGGHFAPHWADIVKQRHPIIQASKKYTYHLSGITKIGKRELYVIHFEPTEYDKEGYIGKMYIDKETLAFEKFEYRSNEERLKWREKELFARLSSKEANNIVMYAPTDGKYYLKTARYTEKFENLKTGHVLEKFSEYVLVETMQHQATPIPYSELSPISLVVAREATPYFESNWRDYPVVQLDENKLMSKSVSDSIFINSMKTTSSDNITGEKRNKLLKILAVMERFSFEYSLFRQAFLINNGIYSLHHSIGNELVNNMLQPSNQIWHFETTFCYKIYKQFNMVYTAAGNEGENYYSEIHKIGFSYNIPIKTYGRQVFLSCQPSYKFQNTQLSLGETGHLFRFNSGELSMKEGKSEVFWGEKSNGFDGRVSLRYQLKRQLWLNAFTGYYYQMNAKPMLRFEDKSGNIFTKKNKNIGLHESGFNLNINALPIDNPLFELAPFYFGFGIVLTL